jgi:hypothetical protein
MRLELRRIRPWSRFRPLLIGVAGMPRPKLRSSTAYSYQAPMKLCDYILGWSEGCGYHRGYGHGYRYHHDDMMAAVHGAAYARTAKVVVILPPSTGQ